MLRYCQPKTAAARDASQHSSRTGAADHFRTSPTNRGQGGQSHRRQHRVDQRHAHQIEQRLVFLRGLRRRAGAESQNLDSNVFRPEPSSMDAQLVREPGRRQRQGQPRRQAGARKTRPLAAGSGQPVERQHAEWQHPSHTLGQDSGSHRPREAPQRATWIPTRGRRKDRTWPRCRKRPATRRSSTSRPGRATGDWKPPAPRRTRPPASSAVPPPIETPDPPTGWRAARPAAAGPAARPPECAPKARTPTSAAAAYTTRSGP